jgi:integrase/recombinase XerD
MTEIRPLLRRMVEDMTVRNLSPTTQRSDFYAVARFSRFFDKSPERLDLEDVRTYQIHLASQGIA